MSRLEFLLRHREHFSKLKSKFQEHLAVGHFVDVTLSCTGGFIRCHQLVISACSQYFRDVLTNNPSQYATVYLRYVEFEDLKALVEFMYTGEVSVSEDRVQSLLRLATDLKIIGLTDCDYVFSQMQNSALNAINALQQDINDEEISVAQSEGGITDSETQDKNQEEVFEKVNTQKKRKHCSSPVNKLSVRKDLVNGRDEESETPMDFMEPSVIKQESVELDDNNYSPDEIGSVVSDTGHVMTSDPLNDFCTLALNSVECVIDGEGTQLLQSVPSTVQGQLHHEHNYTAGDSGGITLVKLLESEGRDKIEIQETVETSDVIEETVKPACTGVDSNNLGPGAISVKPPSFLIDNNANKPPEDSSDSRFKAARRDVFNRIRRSEEELQKAAEMVRRGMTFQTASDTYNIPISTIRFYMARRGILPQRRRGRAASGTRDDDSIHPPFEIIHYRLPDIDKLV